MLMREGWRSALPANFWARHTEQWSCLSRWVGATPIRICCCFRTKSNTLPAIDSLNTRGRLEYEETRGITADCTARALGSIATGDGEATGQGSHAGRHILLSEGCRIGYTGERDGRGTQDRLRRHCRHHRARE